MRLKTGSGAARFLLGLGVGCALALTGCSSEAPVASPTLDLIEIEGLIDPITADYLSARLDGAESDEVEAAVIQIDTPGGLDIAVTEIVQRILDSEVPVIAWVAPRDASVASAGTFITYSANLAYMADTTEIGAATPINLGASEVGEATRTQLTNEAAAFIVDIATTRGRNSEWAESAVREGASIGAIEAERIDVVDGIVSSLDGLLETLDGQEVAVGKGAEERTLETWDESVGAPAVAIRFQDMNPFQRLLHIVSDPEVAFLLLLLGIFGIIFELYNPGIGLAGILGAACLVLGFYALSVLPTNWIGVALIAFAIVFYLVDLQTAGLGVWTIAGSAALVAGGMLLFSEGSPELKLSGWAIGTAVLLTLVFFMSVMTAALRVRLRRPVTDDEGIVGEVAEAKTDIAPEGTVLSKGTLWRARTMETGIAAGSRVKVMATEGLVLLVEPLHEGQDD